MQKNYIEINLLDINYIDDTIKKINFENKDDEFTVYIHTEYNAAFGLGECFNSINHKGKIRTTAVIEKFCNQGDFTYLPIPFCFTENRRGIFLNTFAICEFDFTCEKIIKITSKTNSKGEYPKLYIFNGNPIEIISTFTSLTGEIRIPPKWAFGVWFSANRWCTQNEVEKQLDISEKLNYYGNVVVIEAWSDETSFFRWSEAFPEPEKMIKRLEDKNYKLILWQCPIFKKMLEYENLDPVHEEERAYVEQNKLCIMKSNDEPYKIPDGHWFRGSTVPDFTNPKTYKWWFESRQHLIDMGVAGFKTDGGEFIYEDDLVFFDGSTSIEKRNGFAADYIDAYGKFLDFNHVLFSRAGGIGQQKSSIQWAGDQKSTWEELKGEFNACLTGSLSGIPFWGFDIGGFSGEMPSIKLYERATQLAVFAPIMQWHSEPVNGQFGGVEKVINNDRSPWNVAEFYNEKQLLDRLKYHYNLRANLLPYIYNEVLKTVKTCQPLMRHPFLNFPDDKNLLNSENCFMLGDLLVFAVLDEVSEIEIYLPKGEWTDLFTDKKYNQGYYKYKLEDNKLPVFIKNGNAIALNVDKNLKLGSFVGNETKKYNNLCFYLYGDDGYYHFIDDLGNDIEIKWQNGKIINQNSDIKYNIIYK
jgi:alpha-D-xyloside xylohydrolase